MPTITPGSNTPPTPGPTADVHANPRDVALVILALLAVVAALRFAEVILVPVVLAVLISYALDPMVGLLQRARIPRAFGATLLVTALVVGLVAGGYALRDDATAFVDHLPATAHRVAALFRPRGGSSAVAKVQQAAGELERAASDATRPTGTTGSVQRVEVQEPALKVRDYLLSSSVGVVGLVAQIIVVIFLALYLLAAGDLFKRKLVKIAGPSLSDKKITIEILREIDRQIARFMLVRALISLIVGVLTWIALAIVGLQQAALWGVAAGVLNIVPYAGPTVIAVSAALAGFLQFGTAAMAAVTSGSTIFVATFEGYWLTPLLTSRAGQMNSVAVFVGLLFFGWLWGIWGMLLAVPMLMVIKAVCDRIEDLQAVGELLGE